MFAAVLAIDSEGFEFVAEFFTFLPIVERDPEAESSVGKSKFEPLHHRLVIEAARGEIGQGRLIEFPVVKVGNLVEEFALIGGGVEWTRKFRDGRDFRFPVGLRKGGFAAGREDFASVPEAHAIEPLHELDRVPTFPALARHAAEEALARGHDQVGRFFIGVERAKPRPVASLFFQGRPPRLDERDEVSFRFDSVDSGFCDSWHWFGSGLEPKDLPRYRFHEALGRLARVLVWSAVDFLPEGHCWPFFLNVRQV